MRTLIRAALATVIIGGLACGDSSSGPSGLKPSTEYRGIITGSDGTTAGLVLTFSSAVSVRAASQPAADALLSVIVPVTGIVTIQGGGTVDLTGTLDGDALTVTGGGFTLTGTLSKGKFTGTVTGPDNLSGTFTALSSTGTTQAYAYCGTYSGAFNPGNFPEEGVFNLVVAGTVLSGGSSTGDGGIITFSGRASAGSNGTTKITINTTTSDGTLKADGTITADFSSLSGTYRTTFTGEEGASTGTFEGGLCSVTPTIR